MDTAFKDSKYKEAKELISIGHTVSITAEDTVDYNSLFKHPDATDANKSSIITEVVSNINDLKAVAKYLNRVGLTITKIEVIE